MILNEILNGIKIRKIHGDGGLEISGIALDSQKVGRGYLFAALRGEKQDGHSYIKPALERGAAALLLERVPDNIPDGVTVVDASNAGHGYTATSTSRTTAPLSSSSRAARYS